MFDVYTVDGSSKVPSFEYLPCAAIQPIMGLALVQNGGNLTLCTGANKPTYISACERQSVCKSGDIIPVIRVTPDMVFGTEFAVAATSIKRGDKVCLDTYGQKVTATTADGVAEIVDIESNAAGGKCYVRFP